MMNEHLDDAAHAVVYTPPEMVFQMILTPEVRGFLKDLEQPYFDPCVGVGQFPTCELVWKMFYNMDKLTPESALKALASLHGMDIRPESVKACCGHMIKTFLQAYEFFTGEKFPTLYVVTAIKIIMHNFTVGDSLEFAKQQRAKEKFGQLSLF